MPKKMQEVSQAWRAGLSTLENMAESTKTRYAIVLTMSTKLKVTSIWRMVLVFVRINIIREQQLAIHLFLIMC